MRILGARAAVSLRASSSPASICAPSLGVIADRRMIKMWWLKILTILGSVSCVLLALSPYLGVSAGWIWALIMFMMANVGLNGAGVFYNALLPHMGDDSEMDSISNKAFAAGYLGGGRVEERPPAAGQWPR